MNPQEVVRLACIAAYNMDLDTYEKLGLPEGKWKNLTYDFSKWFCLLDYDQAEKFMNYVVRK